MAADSQGVGEEGIFSMTKLHRVDDCIVGLAGDIERFDDFLRWFKGPQKRAPAWTKENDLVALVLSADGIVSYETPLLRRNPLNARHYAVGTGAMCAKAVMVHQARLGLDVDPVVAVEVAACVDEKTGGAVQIMELSTEK